MYNIIHILQKMRNKYQIKPVATLMVIQSFIHHKQFLLAPALKG